MITSSSTTTSNFQQDTACDHRENAIVTAVPLLTMTAHNSEADNNNEEVLVQTTSTGTRNREEEKTPSTSSLQNHYHASYIILFLIGSLLGIILSFVSLMSIESMYLRYDHDQKFPTTNINTPSSSSSLLLDDRIIYIALLCLSYIRDAFNVLICVVFLCLLLAPKPYKDKLTTAILSFWTGDDDDRRRSGNGNNNIDAAYFTLVFLDGGFLFGSGFMLWSLAFALGEPLPWSALLGLCSVGFSVCYLLILCYSNGTTKKIQSDDDNDDIKEEDNDEFAFVAIV